MRAGDAADAEEDDTYTMDTIRANLRKSLIVAGALAFMPLAPASADRITYDGETWNDVLVYQSSSMYYVKVPEQGIIFNVPIDAVPPSNVIIERDPYYRDDLKKRFEENAVITRRSGETAGSSVFDVDDGAAPAAGGAEQAAQAGPPEDPMTKIKSALGNLGFTFSDEGGDAVGKAPDGSTTIRFKGGSPAGGVDYKSTVPEAQAQAQVMAVNMLGAMAAQGAPWAQEFMQKEVAPLLQSGGSAEKSEGPLSIKADVTKAGGNITLHIVAAPAPPAE